MKVLTSRFSIGMSLILFILISLPFVNVNPLWAAIGLAEQEPGAAHAGPDLIIESITLDPTIPGAGDTVDIAVVIKNQGDAAAGGYRVHFYVDPIDDPPNATTFHTTTTFNGFGLAADTSALPYVRTGHEFTKDDWVVCAWVDRNEEVAEGNEENNQLCIRSSISSTDGSPDDYEEDDSCETAKSIKGNGEVQKHNLVYQDGKADKDWVELSVIGGVKYIAEAIAIGSDADLSIEIYTNCNESDGGGNFGGATIPFTPPADATIYLLVQHNQVEYGPNTDYQLKVTRDDPCNQAAEPNDICTQSADIGVGLGPQSYAFCRPNDIDWFRFPIEAGATYEIDLTNKEDTQTDAQMSLFMNCDQAVQSGVSAQFTASTAGFAYLQVHNLPPAVAGPDIEYNLEVDVVGTNGCQEDSFEQNDVRADAQSLAVGGTPQKHNACPAGDVDWMYFDATQGETYTVETLNLSEESDTNLCLYDETETELACDDDNGPGKGSRITVQAATNTRYWVKSKDYNPEVAGDNTAYEIHLMTNNCQNDNFEPNNSLDGAKSIATDGNTQAHNVCPARDEDWISFTASANTSYEIKTTQGNREGDTIIELYDANGQRLSRNDDYTSGVNSRLIFQFETAGTYYIKTILYNPTSYGTGTEYGISIQPSDAVPTPTPMPTAGPTPPPPPTPSTPQVTAIDTLILVNRTQIVDLFDDAKANQLMNKLAALAQHEKVKGEIIRLDNNSEVSLAYANWNAELTSVAKANLVADAIRRVVLNYIQEREGIEYVVLVGDDRAIPFRRVSDNTPRMSEDTYRHSVDSSHPTGAAIHGNNYLVDDFYVDRESTTLPNGRVVYIPDLAIGRLIETPEQMIGVIDTFLANPVTPVDGFYASGYDFVSDLAENDCKEWGEVLVDKPEPVCLIETKTYTWNKASFLQGHMQNNPGFKFQSISGHASHYSEGISDGGELFGREIRDNDIDLSGGLIYTVGCHGGLNVPANNQREPVDLAEAYVSKKANYVGNTGYGWGTTSGIGLSERVYQLFARELRTGQSSMGSALQIAKKKYFTQDPNFSAHDEKVMQQATFYGLPMYEADIGSLALGDEDDPFEDVGFEVSGSLDSFGDTSTKSVSLNFSANLGEDPDIEETDEGSILSLNGSVHADADEPVLPLHFGSLGDNNAGDSEQPRSVLVLGGEYKVEDFESVIAAPYNEFYTDTTTSLQGDGWFPSVLSDIRNHEGESNLVTRPGQYNQEAEEMRVYTSLDAEVYYSTSSDQVPPEITIVDSLFTRATNNIAVKVGAIDESDIERVLVSYREDQGQGSASIKSQDLTFEASTQKWVGTFNGDLDSRYFVQVIDKAGNITTDTNKGRNYRAAEVVASTTIPGGQSGGTPCPSGKQCIYLPTIKQ